VERARKQRIDHPDDAKRFDAHAARLIDFTPTKMAWLKHGHLVPDATAHCRAEVRGFIEFSERMTAHS
jgi:hypothetical protein